MVLFSARKARKTKVGIAKDVVKMVIKYLALVVDLFVVKKDQMHMFHTARIMVIMLNWGAALAQFIVPMVPMKMVGIVKSAVMVK